MFEVSFGSALSNQIHISHCHLKYNYTPYRPSEHSSAASGVTTYLRAREGGGREGVMALKRIVKTVSAKINVKQDGFVDRVRSLVTIKNKHWAESCCVVRCNGCQNRWLSQLESSE